MPTRDPIGSEQRANVFQQFAADNKVELPGLHNEAHRCFNTYSELLDGSIFKLLKNPDRFAHAMLDPVCGTVSLPNWADFAPEALYELSFLQQPTAP